jgi:pyruvyltransferase
MLFNLFRKPILKAYWWADVPNFGDALAPLLLARFADVKTVTYAPVEDANVVSIGSVLEHIPADWAGHIVGSGRLKENSVLKFDPERVKILGLRGPLTARGIPGDYALGDPGLLANELIDSQEKYWDLGILPHWRDDKLAKRFLSIIPKKFTCRVIQPSKHPIQVIREIAACRRLVTSSLHGIVVADAIGGIPRRVEYCDKLDGEGKMFKFLDYSESIQCPFELGKMIEPKRNKVADRRFEIYDSYRELSRIYGKS